MQPYTFKKNIVSLHRYYFVIITYLNNYMAVWA